MIRETSLSAAMRNVNKIIQDGEDIIGVNKEGNTRVRFHGWKIINPEDYKKDGYELWPLSLPTQHEPILKYVKRGDV